METKEEEEERVAGRRSLLEWLILSNFFELQPMTQSFVLLELLKMLIRFISQQWSSE